MLEYSSILIVPYAEPFSISITAISLSAIGATPFFTSGAAVLLEFAVLLLQAANETTNSRERVRVVRILIIKWTFRCRELLLRVHRSPARRSSSPESARCRHRVPTGGFFRQSIRKAGSLFQAEQPR